MKSKVNEPLFVNVYDDHELFVIIIQVLLSPVSVAMTSLLVAHVISYITYHVTASLSIQPTVAVRLQVVPTPSTKSKINEAFPVKVCVANHPLLVIVTQGLKNEMVAMTS